MHPLVAASVILRACILSQLQVSSSPFKSLKLHACTMHHLLALVEYNTDLYGPFKLMYILFELRLSLLVAALGRSTVCIRSVQSPSLAKLRLFTV